jgi:pimeloyl-ACP methyl ester carboxylesterase
MTSSLKRAQCFSLLAMLLSVATALKAQQTVVLQHGIWSDRSTWEDAAARLQNDFDVITYRFTTGANNSFEDQSASFDAQRAANSLPSNTIAVTHSNGGRVVRMSAASGHPFSAIITVAGTHGGVPLVTSANNGYVRWMLHYSGEIINAPFLYYSPYCQAWWLNWSYNVIETFGSLVYWAVEGADFAIGLGPYTWSPVLGEMQDAMPAQANEETFSPKRVGILSSVDGEGGITGLMAHAAYPAQWQTIRDSQYWSIFFGVALFDYFNNYDENDPNYWPLYEGRYLWVDMAAAVYNVDWYWCDALGAADYYGCYPNDGILPVWVQQFPNGTYNREIVGPSHQEETRSGVFYGQLSAELDLMGVPRK